MPAVAKSPKKTAAKKAPAKKANHPTYQVMVQDAIKALKERKGASRQAIKKYIATEHKVADISSFHFNTALKKLTEAGTLEQSATGQRWKLKKVEAKPVAKKPAAKKPAPKKATSPKKPVKKAPKSPKKTVAKKVAAKKAAKKVVKKPAKKAAPKKAKK